MVYEIQDGKLLSNTFEIWTVSADLNSNNPTCTILVSSFTTQSGVTFVFNWAHHATKISEPKNNIFKIELTGRLNPFSGLDVMLELSEDGQSIKEITGSMRAGSRGQSISQFKIDRTNLLREVAPISNPSYVSE
jgi:hypothetical protein